MKRFGTFALLASLATTASLLISPSVVAVGATPLHREPASTGTATVSRTAQGMRLVLQLRATAYPANALVPVTLRLTNLSNKTVYTSDCLRTSLGVRVTGGGGVDLYPELLPPPDAPWPACPGEPAMGGMRGHTMAIPTGTTITRLTYVVLRAFTVQAWADLLLTKVQTRPLVVLTPAIHLRQTGGSGPAVRIEATHPSLAVVTPVKGGGPIEYSEWVSCGQPSRSYPIRVIASATFSRWMRAPGTTIPAVSPPCTQLNEWMLFVAQPGLPIAHTYYCRQHDRCAYAPPTPREQALAACKNDIGKAVTSGKLPSSAARYAIGLTSQLPPGLTASQQALARQFNSRCAPLLKLKP